MSLVKLQDTKLIHRNLLYFYTLEMKGQKEKLKKQSHLPLQEKDSVQFSSVAQSCPTLCDPMNCSMPGLPVHHQLPEFTQTHVQRVCDAIQPSHPLSSSSPPAPNPSQHQSLFQFGFLFFSSDYPGEDFQNYVE